MPPHLSTRAPLSSPRARQRSDRAQRMRTPVSHDNPGARNIKHRIYAGSRQSVLLQGKYYIEPSGEILVEPP